MGFHEQRLQIFGQTCPLPDCHRHLTTHRFEYFPTSFVPHNITSILPSDNKSTHYTHHTKSLPISDQTQQADTLNKNPTFLISLTPPPMLPYATVQEAEAALGRSLTAAETLWFNYSATKSDYILYCHNIIFLFLIFSLFPFYYLFLEFFFKKSVGPYKIQPKVKLSFSDTLRCYKSVMRMFFLVVGPLQLVSYPSIKVNIFLFFT